MRAVLREQSLVSLLLWLSDVLSSELRIAEILVCSFSPGNLNSTFRNTDCFKPTTVEPLVSSSSLSVERLQWSNQNRKSCDEFLALGTM